MMIMINNKFTINNFDNTFKKLIYMRMLIICLRCDSENTRPMTHHNTS
jgi:hypothetical protein